MNENAKPLDNGNKHLLRLVERGRDATGWAKVSLILLPIVQKLPPELVTVEVTETGGRAKLTEAGETILQWT